MKTKTFFRFFLLGVMTLFTLGAWAQSTPDKDYLCFTANTEGATVELKKNKATTAVTIEYSIDNGANWVTVDFSSVTTTGESVTTTGEIRLEKVGDKVYFRGTNTTFSSSYSSSKYYQFALSGNVAASGNVMSLLNKDCSTTDISADTYKYCFCYLFKDCTSLTAAPTLPATKLASGCYYGMFSGCTNLTAAPALPATTLEADCYYYMFSKCESLATAPTLPATTLAQSCYSSMFNGCTGLTEAPALPATTLEADCYYDMFNGCTGLTAAPKTLPAGQMKPRCYTAMFKGCINLTEAPALPATELAQNCYESMFNGCTGLTAAPELPATTLAQSCYNSMFNGCTGLTAAPELPATTLAQSCYSSMFNGCTGLTAAPELPATTLAKTCYMNMFNGCTNLTTVELPATSFETSSIPAREGCCYQMFNGCEKLNSVKVAFTEWPKNHTDNWLNGVASTGTFVCPAELETETRDASHVPAGWTVKKFADEFTFDDATPHTATNDIECESLTYKRTFAEEGKYEALYLPFSVTMTSDLSDKVTIAKIYMVSTKGSVAGGAHDAGVDVVVVKILDEGESTKPHTPYFIRSKSGTDLEFTQDNTTVYAATGVLPPQGHITCATTMDSYDFIGSYVKSSLSPEGNEYVLQNGGLHKVTAETTQPCNRWKMVKTPTEWNDNYVAPSAKAKMQIITLGEDETTGIIGLDARMNADSTNDAIYTPAGVAVRKQQLTPGLYIQHGKKFIVK